MQRCSCETAAKPAADIGDAGGGVIPLLLDLLLLTLLVLLPLVSCDCRFGELNEVDTTGLLVADALCAGATFGRQRLLALLVLLGMYAGGRSCA